MDFSSFPGVQLARPKLPEPIARINLALYESDLEVLRRVYGVGGYNRVVRNLVRLHVQSLTANVEESDVRTALGLGVVSERSEEHDEGTETGGSEGTEGAESGLDTGAGLRKKDRT